MRLAVVISHPIQHFAPMFRDLAKQPDVNLKVFYCCNWGSESYFDPGFGNEFKWDIPLLEGYEYEFMPIGKRPASLSFNEIDNPAVGNLLEEFGAQIVWIHGYSHRTSWRVWKWAKNKAHILFFGDSELLHKRTLKSLILKRIILPYFFRSIDAFITIGDNNEDYYRHYGVPKDKMFRGAFPVDIKRFQNTAENITPSERARMRREFGLNSNSIVVLFVGKFIHIKHPFDLIEAILKLNESKPKIQALLIGSGELQDQISARIQNLGLENRIRLTGFINQSEMPGVLHMGDILAMCSEKDPHPLAVTEAMAVGNAIVASDRVGCVGPTDSARPGVNTLVYPCGDIKALAEKIRILASKELSLTQDISVTSAAVLRAIESFKKNSKLIR